MNDERTQTATTNKMQQKINDARCLTHAYEMQDRIEPATKIKRAKRITATTASKQETKLDEQNKL